MANSELDDARIQLLLIKMKEDVKKSVETDLFKYYRNLGSIILTVLGIIGVTVGWPALTRLVKEEISAQVQIPVDAAKLTAQEANKIASDILVRLEEKQLRIENSMGRADHKFEEMNSRYGKTNAQIDGIDISLAEMRKILDFLKGQISPQATSAAGDEIEAIVKQLATQTNILVTEVARLSSDTQEKETLVQVNKQLTKITQDTRPTNDTLPPSDLRTGSLVYVQFAGGQRQRAEGMSKALENWGWRVPGEERVAGAKSKHEVRYFHEADKKAAELLARETNDAIIAAGFSAPLMITVKTPVEKLPAKGILEIWLEIPAN